MGGDTRRVSSKDTTFSAKNLTEFVKKSFFQSQKEIPEFVYVYKDDEGDEITIFPGTRTSELEFQEAVRVAKKQGVFDSQI